MEGMSLATAFKYPDIKDNEATALVVAAQAGNLKARDRLIYCHLRLVRYMAQTFARKDTQQIPDLFQDGVIILMEHGIDRFDLEQGIPFRAWATQQLRFRFWKRYVRQRRYNEAIEAYAASLDPDKVLNPETDDADYKWMADLCRAAEKRGLIRRFHSETLLLRARGMPHKYIMERLGISRSAINQRLHRAMDAIREVCDDDIY
jgi:RNA polymerase sigma factor (sigma-70 family)